MPPSLASQLIRCSALAMVFWLLSHTAPFQAGLTSWDGLDDRESRGVVAPLTRALCIALLWGTAAVALFLH